MGYSHVVSNQLNLAHFYQQLREKSYINYIMQLSKFYGQPFALHVVTGCHIKMKSVLSCSRSWLTTKMLITSVLNKENLLLQTLKQLKNRHLLLKYLNQLMHPITFGSGLRSKVINSSTLMEKISNTQIEQKIDL